MTVNGKRADAEQVQREMDRLDRLVAVQAAEIERLRAEVGRLTNGRDTMGNLWAKEKEDNERLRAALRDDPTPEQIYNACLSYRHDFGLLPVEDRKAVVFDATEWLRAWQKTLGERT